MLAKEARATGALMALLRDALQPNLVQSVEGVPAFLHGGPFANIAHGCNSVLATRMALTYADYAVTEAGFAFDLGGLKTMGINETARLKKSVLRQKISVTTGLNTWPTDRVYAATPQVLNPYTFR